jgi:arylsulfatase A-like enzyme
MPFRGGLVTGQHANLNGVRLHGDFLTPDRKTIAHAFKDSGYRTSWVGKWHLSGGLSAFGWNDGADFWVHPYLRGGFEDWFGFELSNHFFMTRYSQQEDCWPPIEVEGYQTDVLTDISLNYLKHTAAKLNGPWFHCVSYEAPHTGNDGHGNECNPAPPEYEAMFDQETIKMRRNVPADIMLQARKQQAGYYAQIKNLDDNIGRLLDYLDQSGQSENTIVLFFSDHGELGGSHGRFHKQEVFEESIRIPMIMRMPKLIPADQILNVPFSGIDIYPTCAGLCGVPIDKDVQGKNFADYICGKSPEEPRQQVLIQWLGKARYGFSDYKFRAIRNKQYTYCICDDPERCALFDNSCDPFQLDNLFGSEEHSALQAQLHKELLREITISGEDIPEFVTV